MFGKKYTTAKLTIERCFTDAKTKHGLEYTRYVGKQRVLNDLILLFSAMNMKKTVNYLVIIHQDHLLNKLISTCPQVKEILQT
jgi:hypothetical protein